MRWGGSRAQPNRFMSFYFIKVINVKLMLVQYVHEVDVKTILFGKYKIEQIWI